ENDPVKKAMRRHGVKTEEELMTVLEQNKLHDVKKIFDLETEENYNSTEIKQVLNIRYSNQKFDRAKVAFESKNKEEVSKLNETLFEPTADYLKFYQIQTKENKVFIMAVIFPYDPYRAVDRIWIIETNKLF